MGDFIDNYSKFLIGNVNFFNYIVDELLSLPKINSKLILRVQKRIKVLKLIESVSPYLEKYFYGENYKDIIESCNIFDNLEDFVDNLLNYRTYNIETVLVDRFNDINLNKICSKTYIRKHNYECSDNLEIRLNSNEFFLEDYSEELDELYFVINEIAKSNINFIITDAIKNEHSREDRISKHSYKGFVNTKIEVIRVEDYNTFIHTGDIDEFLLNRMAILDENPIWKYYLLRIKLRNKELPQTIEKLCSYIKNNYNYYLYLDKELYRFIAIDSIMTLCDYSIESGNDSKFNEYFEELRALEGDLLELINLRAKSIINKNNKQIDEFFNSISEKLSSGTLRVKESSEKELYKMLGSLYEQRGDYYSAAQNYFESGDVINYINKLGKATCDLNKVIYDKDPYSSGLILTSRITSNHKFLSEKNDVNILDIFSHDYARLFTLELCAKEIYSRGVEGEVAELGVFRGDFSSLLNKVFKDKMLYLFDTFNSFDERDIEIENSYKSIPEDTFEELTNGLKKTSVDLVLDKMKYRDNVKVYEGYFEESVIGLEEKFCFVSLDVDLYKPTLEGLKYFYSRLCEGGYIFVHDYNHKLLPGVKKAVEDFEDLIGYKLCKVPLSDQGGTLVITK